MHDIHYLLWIVILSAVIFDFINGFHDAANAVATVISTRVLTPILAITMAASLNFLGAISGTEVAKTIGSGIIGTAISQHVVMAAILSAIIWNIITWYRGIPSSSSHALIGGLVGAGIGFAGFEQVQWHILFQKSLLPTIASPLLGFFVGFLLMNVLFKILADSSAYRVGSFFRRAQVFSAAFMAFSHGSNDAQKTMGIITLGLISAGVIPSSPFHVPIWVIVLSALAMALGTAAGGWRIIRTMGSRLTKLTPIHGFGAETAAASIIETASRFGFPLSTTHVISSTILGVGASRRFKAVRWNIAGRIFQAWILTIPVCAIIAFLTYYALRAI